MTAGPRATRLRVSLRIRKRIEEAFSWPRPSPAAQDAPSRLPKISWQFTFAMAAYNLVRCPSCSAAADTRDASNMAMMTDFRERAPVLPDQIAKQTL